MEPCELLAVGCSAAIFCQVCMSCTLRRPPCLSSLVEADSARIRPRRSDLGIPVRCHYGRAVAGIGRCRLAGASAARSVAAGRLQQESRLEIQAACSFDIGFWLVGSAKLRRAVIPPRARLASGGRSRRLRDDTARGTYWCRGRCRRRNRDPEDPSG